MTIELPVDLVPREDVIDVIHGVSVADPYRWLEDPRGARTAGWIDAQQRLFMRERASWNGVDDWPAAIENCIPGVWHSVPAPRAGRMFCARQAAGQQHPVLMVKDAGVSRVLLDPNSLDPSGGTVLESWDPSPDGALVAVQLSHGGTEDAQLRVIDATDGSTVDGPIDRVRRSPIAWLSERSAFYYVRRLPPSDDPAERPYHRRVVFHEVGTACTLDVEVFGAGRDRTEFYDLQVSPDGRWLVVVATRGTRPDTDLWMADLQSAPADRPRLQRVDQVEPARTRIHIGTGVGPRDRVHLRTTRGAPNGCVVRTTVDRIDAVHWRRHIAERAGAVLTGMAVLDGAELANPVALVSWTRRAVAELTLHDLRSGDLLQEVFLPGAGTIGAFSTCHGSAHETWFSYQDHTSPPGILRFDARTRQVRSWTLDGGTVDLQAAPVQVHMAEARSADGTAIAIFVIAPEAVPDRPRPTILTGYGGFGVSMTPYHQPDVLAWVQGGGVYAVACVRGGGEGGRNWHLAGSGVNKPRAFEDFEAAADHLVAAGWTSPGQLGLLGGSGGGLLVGAALTRRPGHYGAVVSMAPLLDMVRYERSGLGPSWVGEYGSAADPDGLRLLASYSPYHRVQRGTRYPPVLLVTYDGDTRVDPLHARKMCASLQDANPGRSWLRHECGVGHGVRARKRGVAAAADVLAFFGHHLGSLPPSAADVRTL